MGQARQRGSFEERKAQSLVAERAKREEIARLREEARKEHIRQVEEARRLSPKFEALPPVLRQMVLAECAARGVEPLWLKPPAAPRPVKNPEAWPTPRRPQMGVHALVALACALGGGF